MLNSLASSQVCLHPGGRDQLSCKFNNQVMGILVILYNHGLIWLSVFIFKYHKQPKIVYLLSTLARFCLENFWKERM